MTDPGTVRRWAQEELARPEYARARPGWLQRLLRWVDDQLSHLGDRVGLGAGQLLAVLIALLVTALVVIVVVRRTVRLRVAGASSAAPVLGGSALTGAEHRRRAELARAAGRYDDAVRESLRALAQRLDERGMLDPRPGRTADELAAETSRLLPQLADDLRRGAATFDAVTYGSHAATVLDADRLAALDLAVEAARPHQQPGPAPLVGVS